MGCATCPSSGALFPLRLNVAAVRRVERLEPGPLPLTQLRDFALRKNARRSGNPKPDSTRANRLNLLNSVPGGALARVDRLLPLILARYRQARGYRCALID